jgi:uncharacterized protein YecE (DUF72 family)
MASGTLHIGTAGWNVPSRYRDAVPGEGSHLERYAGRLSVAEINSSFHRPHQRKTYERWARSTPDHFRFAVKLPKAITHEARLAGCDALLDQFASEVKGLGKKLGILLVQLPPKGAFDEKIAERFFRDLRARIRAPIALEPRHASWFEDGMDAWLSKRRIARVAADPARVDSGGEPGGWRRLAYYRWHGAPRVYFSDYSAEELGSLRQQLDASRARGASVWCVFDNTASGAALGNALSLAKKFADGAHQASARARASATDLRDRTA